MLQDKDSGKYENENRLRREGGEQKEEVRVAPALGRTESRLRASKVTLRETALECEATARKWG